MILPPKGTSVKELEALLSKPNSPWNNFYFREHIFQRLEIPKHEISNDHNLADLLQSIGIENIFNPSSNLLGVGGACITQAQHRTYFRTDEDGSEGYAVTAMHGHYGASPPPVEFIADRPFLELIVSEDSGRVLFLNRIEDFK